METAIDAATKETRISFPFKVETPNSTFNVNAFELPKHTYYVKGLQLISDHPDRLYHRGRQRIEIGGEEVFPDGFDSKLLMASVGVAPRERFFDLGRVLPGDLSIKIRFEDQEHDAAPFESGYKVSLVVLIQEKR